MDQVNSKLLRKNVLKAVNQDANDTDSKRVKEIKAMMNQDKKVPKNFATVMANTYDQDDDNGNDYGCVGF